MLLKATALLFLVSDVLKVLHMFLEMPWERGIMKLMGTSG